MEKFRNPLQRDFHLNDGGEDLFIQDIVFDLSGFGIRHELRDRVFFLKVGFEYGKCHRNSFDISKEGTGPRSADLNDQTGFSLSEPSGHIIRLYLIGAPAGNARARVYRGGIAEQGADASWPL